METESSISDVDQERATSLSRFINFVKNAMKSAKVTTASPPSDTSDDDMRGAIHQEDTADDDDPDISELLNSPKDRGSESDRFSNLKLVLFPCEDYEYCGSGRKYQQNNNQSLNEAAKSLEKFVHSNNREPGDRDRSFDDSDKACVSHGSLIDSGSENDSAEEICCPGQCHIEDCKLSFEEYFDFSDDTENEES